MRTEPRGPFAADVDGGAANSVGINKKLTGPEVASQSFSVRMGASPSSPVSVPVIRSKMTEAAGCSRVMLQ